MTAIRKIVINGDYGGFSVSEAAARRMAELGSACAAHEVNEYDRKNRGELTEEEAEWHAKYPTLTAHWYGYLHGDRKAGVDELTRDDPFLVQVVEEMGRDANGTCAHLQVVVIPAGVEWQIEEYDGSEWVSEKHRTWS